MLPQVRFHRLIMYDKMPKGLQPRQLRAALRPFRETDLIYIMHPQNRPLRIQIRICFFEQLLSLKEEKRLQRVLEDRLSALCPHPFQLLDQPQEQRIVQMPL